ncbi:hypothetical protein [Pseudomonas phage PJNP013]|uniref:Uncharacterized protein n=1 Tax=Pseudomonas phage PJNP013 TaxID=3108093 RepID=A0ABZ2CQR0_9CAUD
MLSRQDREARAWHQQDAAWQRLQATALATTLDADQWAAYRASRVAWHRRALELSRAAGRRANPWG